MRRSDSSRMELANRIVEYIRSEGLSVGDPLPSTRELAAKWNIGRNIVRQGLMQAQTLGLVRVRPRSGAFVQQPNFSVLVDALTGSLKTTLVDEGSNLSHLMEARFAVEGNIAGDAAARRSSDDLFTLQQAMEGIEKSIRAVIDGRQHRSAFVEADEKFHLTVARLAGNPVLTAMLQALLTLLRGQRMGMELTEQEYRHGNHLHRKIYQSILDGDAEKAQEAMEEHLIDYRKQVVARVAR